MQNRNRCILCRAEKDAIHHVNGDDEDNAAKNRVPVCTRCHGRIHSGSTMRALPWFARLPMSARDQPLPKVGRECLKGRHRTAYRMDVRLKRAYTAAREALVSTDSQPTGEQYRITGFDITARFAHQFKPKTVSHSSDGVYEHRVTPVELVKQGAEGVLRLPVVDDEAAGTTRAREAYRAFLATLKKQHGLHGFGGEITEYEV